MVSCFLYKRAGSNESGDSLNTSIRLEIDNIESLSVDMNMPVSAMPLPMEDSSENILVKMEGNSEGVNLSWAIPDTASAMLRQRNIGDIVTGQVRGDAEYEWGNVGGVGISNIVVDNGGINYAEADTTVSFSAPNVGGGVAPTAKIESTFGTIHTINVLTSGSGYTSAPTVTITSTAGSAANSTAHATINNITWTNSSPVTGNQDAGRVVNWILKNFEGRDIKDEFWLAIPDQSIRTGWVPKITFRISGDSPVVWQGSLTFLTGNVISAYDADAPNSPRNFAVNPVNSSGLADGENSYSAPNTKLRLRWQAPSDSATTITRYKIYRRTDLTSYEVLGEITPAAALGDISNDNDYYEFADTGLDTVAGEHVEYYVTAVNTGGEGMKSDERAGTAF